MENMQMPQVQQQMGSFNAPNSMPISTQSGAMPMVQQVEVRPPEKKDVSGLVKTIIIVILSLITLTFVGLFIWMFVQYNDSKNDIDGQINMAVAEAVDKKTTELEAEFADREKYPAKNFSGPVDYGELSFQFPKTWSVYIQADASKGGDFMAFLNPDQIDPISNESVYALRVSIMNKSFESVVDGYRSSVEKKDATLKVESVVINDITANLYSGTIPSTHFQGYILVFKIRDKTAELRTDSLLFEEDFLKLIQTIKFNA